MPEPISRSQPNSCQVEDPEPLVCSAPATSLTRASAAAAPPQSEPAVQQLVATHPSSVAAAPADCTGEGVAFATAVTRTAISLVKVIGSAPTEVGLAYTLTGFILDAAGLGAATAKLLDCEEARARKPPP